MFAFFLAFDWIEITLRYLPCRNVLLQLRLREKMPAIDIASIFTCIACDQIAKLTLKHLIQTVLHLRCWVPNITSEDTLVF